MEVAVVIGHLRHSITQQLVYPIDRRLQQWTGEAQLNVRDTLLPPDACILDKAAQRIQQ
jgi:hypothetical protein